MELKNIGQGIAFGVVALVAVIGIAGPAGTHPAPAARAAHTSVAPVRTLADDNPGPLQPQH